MAEKSSHDLPSQMIRVPTPLIDSVRELSRLHREGQTPLLLEGLQALIVKADSSAAIKVSHHDETLHQIVDLLQTMRHQLEKVEIRLARLEAGQSRRTGNLRYVPPIPQQAEFQTFEEENLAKRLGVDVKTIIQQRATNSPQEFERWSRHRDPGQLGWRYQESDRLYHPVRQ